MSVEPSHLLLVGSEPNEGFVAALEGRGLRVATAPLGGIESALGQERPELVVYFGFQGSARLVDFLGRMDEPKLRAALLVERSALAQARQLDRKVVATVLPQDMRTDVLVGRLVTLARRQHSAVPGPLPPTALPLPNLPAEPTLPTEPKRPAESSLPEPALPRPATPSREALPPVPPAPPARRAAENGVASSPAPRRVVLFDDDVTRGDLLAQALREQGLQVRLAPTDPARTRWVLLRRFRPELFLLDSGKAPRTAWVEHHGSDPELARVPLRPVPLGRLFDETSGTVRGDLLLQRVVGDSRPAIGVAQSPAAPAAPPSTKVSAPPSERTTSEEFDDERPTLIYEDSVVARLPEGAADSTAPAAEHVPDSVDELLREGPASVEIDSAQPLAVDGAPRRSTRFWLRIAAALSSIAALGAGCLWWFLGPGNPEVTSVSAAEPEPNGAAPSKPTPSEPAAEAAAPELPPPSPWEKSENPEAQPCESLVEDAASLARGDVAQASLAWKRARNALVLGDIPLAQTWMCRAALLHDQSLAVEALAESYLEMDAPRQAKRWVDVALTHRAGRARTLELLGDIEHQLGHLDEARRAWLQAFRIEDGAERTLALLGKKLLPEAEAALRGTREHRAEVLFRRAATFRPEDPEPVLGLARVAHARQRRERALSWIDEALRRQPEAPAALALRAEIEGAERPEP